MPLDSLPSWLNAVVCGLLLLFCQVQGQDLASPIRNTSTGQVRGGYVHVKDTKSGVHTFLGIPFAKPPVGPLCFAPPEPPEPWSGHLTLPWSQLQECTEKQRQDFSDAKVMVWIRGGGPCWGMASTYDGSALATIEEVVVVTIQYNLGILGFFSTEEEHARGNWGYLDYVAALHWVRQSSQEEL